MRKILILGQSVTAIKAIEQIRAADQESEITVIGFGGGFPSLKERFPEWISRQIVAEHVVYKNEKFYHNLRVEFIFGRKITRINFGRKTVFLDDKTKVEADILIVADSDKDYFSDVKGWNREGVFSLKAADEIVRLQGMMSRIDTVIIESSGLRGVIFAKAMSAQNKEVIFCIPSGGLLPEFLDNEISDFLIMLMQQSGMRVLRNSVVKEIFGDDDVKAARLNVGKVIACEAVIFSDVPPDLRIYNKGGLKIDGQISVDELLQTSCEGVFAVDEMTQEGSARAQFFDYEGLRHSQSLRLAAGVIGTECADQSAIRHVCMNISSRELLFIGDVFPGDSDVFTVRDDNGQIRVRVFLKNDVVIGAFLVDNTDVGNHMAQLIKTGQVINWDTDLFFSAYAVQKEEFFTVFHGECRGSETFCDPQNNTRPKISLAERSEEDQGMV